MTKYKESRNKVEHSSEGTNQNKYQHGRFKPNHINNSVRYK